MAKILYKFNFKTKNRMRTQIIITSLLMSSISVFGQWEDRKEDRHDDRREERHIENVEVKRAVRNDREYNRSYKEIPHEDRARYYGYRAPVRAQFIWGVDLIRDFRIFYPEISVWKYQEGYRIPILPAYDANTVIGEISTVYGRVVETYYDPNNDQYYLYFGENYPNHIFNIIIPGPEARYISPNPDSYFNGQHVSVTGYVTQFDNRPEIIIRKARQIEVY